jgi:DNA-binding NarL/FixJ family response regulator
MRSIGEVVWLPTASPATLISRVESATPDLVVIATEDFRPSKWLHPDLLRVIFLNTPTILLTIDSSASTRRRAARFGIYSVLPLDVTTPQLLTALAAAGEGLAVTLPDPFVEADNLITGLGTDQVDSLENASSEHLTAEHLTAREIEVLRLMANGRSNKQIAALLRVSEHTAKFHVSSVLAKLGASSRTEAVSLGITRGMVAI